jgi:hypothetical protein
MRKEEFNMAMLQEYHDSQVTKNGNILLERIDCHFLGGSSDKVYIGTVQKNKATGKFDAICYYARRGNSLNTNELCSGADQIYTANRAADAQMKTKVKGGYKLIGQWKGEGSDKVRPEVMVFLRQQYPIGSTVENPETGGRAVIVAIDDVGVFTVEYDYKQSSVGTTEVTVVKKQFKVSFSKQNFKVVA